MKRRHTLLALILAAGILYRLALMDHVVVNYDDGLYLHDAALMLKGQIPIVDYPSRSPLFHLALTPLFALPFDIVTNYRLWITVLAAATTVMVYLVGAQLHSPRAGLAAAALYYLNPFVATYGLWIKTEILTGGVVLGGLWLLHRGLDPTKHHSRSVVGLACVFGAGWLLSVAVLIRRSALIIGVVVGIYILWRTCWYHRDYYTNTSTALLVAVYSVGAIGGSVVLYGVLTDWRPALMRRFFEVHVLGLVSDGGFGAFEYLYFMDLSQYLVDADTAIRDWPLFRKFGPLVVNRFESIIRENLLVMLPLLGYFRGYMAQRPEDSHLDYYVRVGVIVFAFLLLAQHAVALAINEGWQAISIQGVIIGRNTWTAVLLVLGGILLYTVPKIPVGYAKQGHRRLIWWILIALVIAYSARNRVVYIEYWLDLAPYAALVAGVAAVYWHDHIAWSQRRVVTIGGWVVAVFVVSSLLITPVALSYGDDQFKPSDVRSIRSSVITHSDPGDTVLTGQPLFVIGSGREVALNLGRSYYFIREAPGSPPADTLSSRLEAAACDPSTTVAITGPAMKVLTTYNPRVAAKIAACYNPVYVSRLDMNTGDERSSIMVHARES